MKICDLHTDFLTAISSKTKRENYAKNVLSKCGLIVCAVFTTGKNIGLHDIEKYKEEIEFYNKKYGTNLVLSIEDIGFLKSIEEVKMLITLKPIMATLTWNYENKFAGGAKSNAGLTNLGKTAVKLFEQSGIFVDTAHLNRKSFFEFTKITTKPIICSHANIFAIHKNSRNLTNKQIETIIKSNGFLGLTVYQKFISKEKISSEEIAKQFDYLIKNYGDSNFGFGTDLFGIDKEFLPTNINTHLDLNNIALDLKFLGYSEKTISKICYINTLKKISTKKGSC